MLLATTVLTLAVPLRARAASTVPVGGEFQITNNAAGSAGPTFAPVPTGGFIMVWINSYNAPFDIMARRYDGDAHAVGSEILLNSESGIFPGVSVADDASFVVVWQQHDADLMGIYGRRVDSSGAAGTEFQVNAFTTGQQVDPDVAMAADGRSVATWLSYSPLVAGHDGIFAQRYDSAGNPAGTEFQVNAETTACTDLSKAVFAPDGGFLIAWLDCSDLDGDGDGVFARLYDSAGAALGSEFQVNTQTVSDQILNDVVSRDDGTFILIWHVPGGVVFGQRLDAAGAPLGTEFQVNSGGGFYSSVATASDGGFVVVWDQGGTYLGRNVFGRHFDSSVGSSRVDLQACKLEYSIVSPK